MRIVIAIDSFKDSLSSMQAGNAVRDAVLDICVDAQVSVRPLADGGEGTVDALATGLDGEMIEIPVTGPLGTPVTGKYCILSDGTAVMEMASAAGITLVPLEMRDPMQTTTYGVGEMIRDAINRGCRRFIMGIGGSATNDGGAGMLSALGFELLDEGGCPIHLGGKGLEALTAIRTDNVLPTLKECTFRVACDVTNPLCGPNGCSTVFGPQKGATPETIAKMDGWLKKYAMLAAVVSNKADANCPGTGAAGGLGFAFLAFLNATLEPGIHIILDETRLESFIQDADIVVTGEGRLDSQTVMGKAPIGVARLAKKYGKKVIAFSGCITDGATACNNHGIDAFFPIIPGVVTLEEALDPENAYKNLQNTARQVFRLICLQ